MEQTTLQLSPAGRASSRAQMEIDWEMDQRLSSGEALREDEIAQISEHHLVLLRQSGLRKRNGTWRLAGSGTA